MKKLKVRKQAHLSHKVALTFSATQVSLFLKDRMALSLVKGMDMKKNSP